MILGLFAVAVAVELLGVALDQPVLQWLAKPLLAPLLLGHLWRRRGWPGPVGVALLFATAGDVALLVPGTTAFVVGMACFLGTQVSLVTAFLRERRPSVAVLLGYAVLWAVLNALLWFRLGPLRLPILVYSLALSAMAATAAGVSRRVAAGGALFLVSDLLIGLEAAGMRLPGHGLLVMSTYSAALLLITVGWLAVGTARRDAVPVTA